MAESVPTAFVGDAPKPPPVSVTPPDTRATTTVTRAASDALGWIAIAATVAVVAAGNLVAFHLDRAGSLAFWLYAIAPTVAVAAVALVRAARDGELVDLVRPEWGDATKGLLSAALLVCAAVVFEHAVTPSGSARESWMARLYLQLGDPRWLRAHTPLITTIVSVAAAAEEVTWRGLVTRLIAEQVGSRTAWIWAAFPYALAMLPTAWALRDPVAGLNPLLVLAALGFGLVWGGLARFTGRLAPGILSHAAFAWCVIMTFRLWGSGV